MRGFRSSFRFDDPELEELFEEHQRPVVIRLFALWCMAQCVLLTASMGTGFVVFGTSQYSLLLCFGQVAVQAFLIIVACLTKVPSVGRRAASLFAVSSLMLLGWSGWMIHSLSLGLVVQAKQQEIPEVWKLVGTYMPSSAPFEAFLEKQFSGKILLLYLLFNFLVLDLIRFVGSLRCIASACIVLPVVVFVTTFASSAVSNDTIEMMAASVGLSAYAFFSSAHIIGMRRRQFELGQQVESLLRREADTLRHARESEAAQKEASQRADSMLNHILKNIMADSIGCIDISLALIPVENREELQRAVTCLMRGMKWCKCRQALLLVAQNSYCPVEVPVNLREFGESLVQGRQVVSQFHDQVVLLDQTLCDIICENALVNASRHGHPENPDVHFSVLTSDSLPVNDAGDGDRVVVTFRVTNRPNPMRPQVTEAFVQQVLGRDNPTHAPHSTALSEGLGLQHLFAAAKTLGMTVTLLQDDDAVVFSATCVAKVTSLEEVPSPAVSVDFAHHPLPSQLRILCLDDSDVSRRLLKHALTHQVPGAEVLTFGSVPADVDVFKKEALRGADILVLDQNLDYDDVHMLGSDAARALVREGFTGFICIRSANVSPQDLATYFSCGAHQAIGKDIRAPVMVQTLLSDFSKFRSGHHHADDTVLDPPSNLGCNSSSAPVAGRLPESPEESSVDFSHSWTECILPPGTVNNDSISPYPSFHLGIASPHKPHIPHMAVLGDRHHANGGLPSPSDARSDALLLPLVSRLLESRDSSLEDLRSQMEAPLAPGTTEFCNISLHPIFGSGNLSPRSPRVVNHRRDGFDSCLAV